MGSRQFYFKWPNHKGDLVSSFKRLLTEENLMDVTLYCEGQKAKAHKLILSASSPIFSSIFIDNPNQYPVIALTDTKYSDLKIILEFIYNGEIYIPRSQLSGVLKTAEVLKINGLLQCEEVAKDSAEVSTSQSKKRKRRRKRSSSSESDDVVEIPSKVKPSEPPVLSQNWKESSFASNAGLKNTESVEDEIEIIENPPIINLEVGDDEIEIEREKKDETFESKTPSKPTSPRNQVISTITFDPSTSGMATTSTPISNKIKISNVRTETTEDDNNRLFEDSTSRHFSQVSTQSSDIELPASSSQTDLDENVSDTPREEAVTSEPSIASTSRNDSNLSEPNNSNGKTLLYVAFITEFTGLMKNLICERFV
ncbi:protein tramtrack, beta isoform-like [Centruroides vittatus]|uniref:protein tramtrack, beta isoform-like n=1 Tax=Centruroides vittatus TaxID=120091 RepID=UPI0035103631